MTQTAKAIPMTNEKDLQSTINPLVETATMMIVKTVQDKESAVLFVRDINESIKKVVEFFKPMKSAAAAAHKAVCARENEVLAKAQDAKGVILLKVSSFDQEQEKIRLAEEAKLREKALKDHEKALEKAQANLDFILSKSTDSQETIDLLNMELARDDLNDIERQKIESQIEIQAAILENNQEKFDEVQARVQEPVFMEPVIVPKAEHVAGSVTVKDYEIQITNPLAVFKAIGAGILPISCGKVIDNEIRNLSRCMVE